MKTNELKQYITDGFMDDQLIHLYGKEQLEKQKKRYIRILEKSYALFGDEEVSLFSAPGRTEIGGNHTDHQLGKVVAASINLDAVACVSLRNDAIISYHADDFDVKDVNVTDLSIHPEEKNTTESLLRGVAAGFDHHGYTVGGFNCYADSEVLSGSGMSSSACFEVLIGTIMNEVYNKGKATHVEVARIGQYAENVYFMKNSGLLDQMACSIGSFAYIDFKDPENPYVEKIDFDPGKFGYDLILTDVRASHADLSDEYSLVPEEMKAAARVLGKEVLCDCTLNELVTHCKEIREKYGDRAFLRAYHFVNETTRAEKEAEYMKKNDIASFFAEVNASGRSSWMYLQNISAPGDSKHQAIAVALALSESLLKTDGAWRVHGGGFAGTIQAYVKKEETSAYIEMMESVFGKGCCYKLSIRDCGGVRVI